MLFVVGLENVESASKSQQESLRRSFHLGFEGLRGFLLNAVAGGLMHAPLAAALRRLLLQTAVFIYNRGFSINPNLLQLGIDYCYSIPVVRLFLNGILHPLLADSNEYSGI